MVHQNAIGKILVFIFDVIDQVVEFFRVVSDQNCVRSLGATAAADVRIPDVASQTPIVLPGLRIRPSRTANTCSLLSGTFARFVCISR